MDYTDSDSEEPVPPTPKRSKSGETQSDEDWTADSSDDRIPGARSDVIQRAFNRANAQSNGSNRPTGGELQSSEAQKSTQSPVLVANAKGVVKVDPKQMPNLTSGVYVMSRKDGIIKLDSSPGGKIGAKGGPPTAQGVLMVQNRSDVQNTIVRKQIVPSPSANSITPVKVVSKADGSQVVTQMKVISKSLASKSPRGLVPQKSEPIKIQPKPDPNQLPQIHVVTAVPSPLGLAPRITPTTATTTTTTIRPNVSPQMARLPEGARPLLPRPALRGTAPSSVLGVASRTPVRAPIARQGQTIQQNRQVLQKRVGASPQGQARGKISQVQASPGQKPTGSPIAVKPKTPIGKPQSLLSSEQKLLMAKRKAQEAVGLAKSANRGLLAGARAAQARGRSVKLLASPNPPNAGGKPKESKLADGDGLHMEFHEVGGSESSSDNEPEIPPGETAAAPGGEPESPERAFTLCPISGRIIGPDGEPMETQEHAQEVAPIVTTSKTEAPGDSTLDSLTDAAGLMRVEMSPGGTTGTILQSGETPHVDLPTPELPCLDDAVAGANVASEAAHSQEARTENSVAVTTAAAAVALATTTTTTTATTTTTTTGSVDEEKANLGEEQQEEKNNHEETGNLVTITGEDGVVYQVAGHAEDGQTLLVTRSGDGDQSCVYVTTEQQGDDGSVLTLDHAVAEAVAQLIPDNDNLAPQFYAAVKEGENEQADSQMVMSIMDSGSGDVTGAQEDADGQAQVVAQVVQADQPTPGK